MATRSPRSSSRPAARTTRRAAATMPFDRRNYVLLGGALALALAGYALMLVDNAVSSNPVDSPLSLVVAPLLLLAGYLGVAGAVLHGVPREADPTVPEARVDEESALVPDETGASEDLTQTPGTPRSRRGSRRG